MRMVWKKHTTLAVGYQILGSNKSYVVFWYCQGKAATTNANPNGDGANADDFLNHRKSATEPYQVGEACMVDADTGGKKYDKCFNDIQIAAINKLRYNHQSDALKVET